MRQKSRHYSGFQRDTLSVYLSPASPGLLSPFRRLWRVINWS